MDISATLTTDETEALSNTTDSLENTTRRLLESGKGSFADGQDSFEICLRLKNTLDKIEREGIIYSVMLISGCTILTMASS
jgi:hypothetical protein